MGRVALNSNLCDYLSINIKTTYQDLVQVHFNVTSIFFPIMKTGSWVPFTNKKMQRNCSFYVGGCFLHPTSVSATQCIPERYASHFLKRTKSHDVRILVISRDTKGGNPEEICQEIHFERSI